MFKRLGRARFSPNDFPTGSWIALSLLILVVRDTDLQAPPRFDGAGYAVLGEALATGQGYREIDHPDARPHAHFPPAYPMVLGALWRVLGRSVAAAHLASTIFTVAAGVLAWRWFRTLYHPGVAAILGTALAVNWTWARVGGAIQSEPLYLLLGQAAILGTAKSTDRNGSNAPAALGVLLAFCVLTRHVGITLVAAILLDLARRRRHLAVAEVGGAAAFVVSPWLAWLASARTPTQASLLSASGDNFLERVATLGWFYVQRIPDALTGPFVEVATVFGRSRLVAVGATVWALALTSLMALGVARALRSRRRRLAGLIACSTLGLLLVWPFTEAGRFLIPLVPCLLILATEGSAALVLALGRRRLGRPRRVAAGLLLAGAIPYSVHSAWSNRPAAERKANAPFDAACEWLAREATVPGPVLSRHPGEVYWRTGRHSLAPEGPGEAGIEAAIRRHGVAYLLDDEGRYADAPPTAFHDYAARNPDRVREVPWHDSRTSAPRIYEARPGQGRGPSNVRRP